MRAGITGGQQTAFKKEYKKTQGKGLAPYDLMLFTNAAMLGVALERTLLALESCARARGPHLPPAAGARREAEGTRRTRGGDAG